MPVRRHLVRGNNLLLRAWGRGLASTVSNAATHLEKSIPAGWPMDHLIRLAILLPGYYGYSAGSLLGPAEAADLSEPHA